MSALGHYAVVAVPLAGLIWGLRVAARRARIIPPPVTRVVFTAYPVAPALPDRMPARMTGADGPPSVPLSQLEQIAFAAIAAELRRAARACDHLGES